MGVGQGTTPEDRLIDDLFDQERNGKEVGMSIQLYRFSSTDAIARLIKDVIDSVRQSLSRPYVFKPHTVYYIC